MDVDGFLHTYGDLVATSEGEEPFTVMQMMCPGLSSAKLGKLLGKAVNYCQDGEVYCEIGTYAGYTLIAASYHNYAIPCIGIDNFQGLGAVTTDTEKKRVDARLKANLGHFNFGNQQIIDSDYKKIEGFKEKKIGVFFIDGYHNQEEAYNGLKWGHDKLADDALVFIDDITCWGVADGINDWMAEHKDEYFEFFRMNNYYPKEIPINNQCGHSFWHGLSILKFKRKQPSKPVEKIESKGEADDENGLVL